MADFRHGPRPFRFWLPYWSSPDPKNPTSPPVPPWWRLGHNASSKSPFQPRARESSPPVASESRDWEQLKTAQEVTLPSSTLASRPEDHSNKQPSESERKFEFSSLPPQRNRAERQTTRKMSGRPSSTSEKSSHKLTAAKQVTSQLQSQNLPPTLLAKSNIKESPLANDSNLLSVEPRPSLKQLVSSAESELPQAINPDTPESKEINHPNRQPAKFDYDSINAKGKFLADLDSTFTTKPPQSKNELYQTNLTESEHTHQVNSKHKPGQGKDDPMTKVEPNQELPDKDSSSININKDSKNMPETQVEYPKTEANNFKEPKGYSRLATASKKRPISSPLQEVSASSNTKSEHKDENEQKPTEDCSAKKESRIVISAIPRDSLLEGEHAAYKKDIEEGFTRLRQKIGVLNSKQPCNGQGLNIITLAGNNKGASMAICYETVNREGFCNETIWNHNGKASIAANINSNVQNINNSSLHESFCSTRNPGVNMNLSSALIKSLESSKTKEIAKAETRDSNKGPAQKPVSGPRIRRRCLRALFLESSESDPENPRKPRRHGCRYSCNEKEDDNVGTSTNKHSNSR